MKLVLRTSDKFEDSLKTFVLINFLKKKLDLFQVFVICPPEQEYVFKLLDFDLNTVPYVPMHENSVKEMLHVHKWSVNQLDIFNVDLFINLKGDRASHFMGKSFAAARQISTGVSFSKLFSVPGEKLDPQKDLLIQICEVLEVPRSFEDFKMRILAPAIGNTQSEPYVLVSLGRHYYKEDKSLLKITDFLNEFKGARIVWTSFQNNIDDFSHEVEDLAEDNYFQFERSENVFLKFASIVQNSLFVISDNLLTDQLSILAGKDTFSCSGQSLGEIFEGNQMERIPLGDPNQLKRLKWIKELA